MKKNIFLSLVLGVTLSSCAMFSSDSSSSSSSDATPAPVATPDASQNCAKPLQDAQNNLNQIKTAFANKDACTAGRLQIERYNMIQNNLSCFPGYPKGEYALFKIFDKLDTSIDPVAPQCSTPKAKVVANSQKIKSALMQNDGCTAGNVELDTLALIKSNPSCFPQEEQSLDNMINAINEYKNEQAAIQQQAN